MTSQPTHRRTWMGLNSEEIVAKSSDLEKNVEQDSECQHFAVIF